MNLIYNLSSEIKLVQLKSKSKFAVNHMQSEINILYFIYSYVRPIK